MMKLFESKFIGMKAGISASTENILKVSLKWATPGGDDLIANMARVSNPANQDNKQTAPKLIKYLIDHKHWSPFEMVNACAEIQTTRDISHQIIRHRSFAFQEFSGRYAEYVEILRSRELRLKGSNNRQGSVPSNDRDLGIAFDGWAREAGDFAEHSYRRMLDSGIANEVARSFLPEGLVPTTMYMNGPLRSWIHYWDVRCTPETQKEHRLVAEATRDIILAEFPVIAQALGVEL